MKTKKINRIYLFSRKKNDFILLIVTFLCIDSPPFNKLVNFFYNLFIVELSVFVDLIYPPYILYRVSKKNVISGVWCKIVFFVPFSCMVFFFYFSAQKKNPRNFYFSQHQKFRKAKMCICIISIKF